MAKTVAEINERIRSGRAVVVTAEQMSDRVDERGAAAAAAETDVVTTGTFGPMCSSGVLLNTGHTRPKMNYKQATLNGVPAYCGIAAVDLYLGATAIPEDDPANKVFPGAFAYGGGHVIEDLVAGRELVLRASSYGSHCYPRRELATRIRLADFNTAQLLNPRNGYQNYNAAVNAHAAKPIYTYMGILRPRLGNVSYCSAGGLSPLLCDPHYRTIGLGSRIFLGGGVGLVIGPGTQHDPDVARNDRGVPTGGAGTMALSGDLKQMEPQFVRGVSLTGYGVSLAVGIGVPIPVLDAEVAAAAAIRDEQIMAPVWDYSRDYPQRQGEPLATVSYAELRSGRIELQGKQVRTAALSSLVQARRIAEQLADWIRAGRFELTAPIMPLPGPGQHDPGGPLDERPLDPPRRPPNGGAP